MIVAIEGPDKSGKTTLLEPLAVALRATVLRRFPTPPALMPVMPHVEVLYLQLLREMYDPDRTYVSDRSPTLTAQVYSRVFERRLLIDVGSAPPQTIVYVRTPIDVLRARHELVGDEVFPLSLYERVIAEYERLLATYTDVVVVDGCRPVRDAVVAVLRYLRAPEEQLAAVL